MDFTEIYPQSSFLVSYSPGNQFLLSANDEKLIVRRSQTLQITHVWDVGAVSNASGSSVKAGKAESGLHSAPITHISWSCDSEYVLAACASRSFVSVFKLRDESWSARITSGVEGLVDATWAPDGRSILCFSDWSLRVTIWSLVANSATYIQYPSNIEKCWAFRNDGRYLILAERQKSKDAIGIYDAEQSFKLIKHFSAPTASMASMALSPRGSHLAIWENVLEYKLHVLTLTGRLVASFAPESDPGLGIRSVAWHPGGTFLAVGGWDANIHLLDNMSWRSVYSHDFCSPLSNHVATWREPKQWLTAEDSPGFVPYERVLSSSVTIDPPKTTLRSGVTQLEWNIDGTLFMARLENAPTVVFIFHVPGPTHPFRPKLQSVLIHREPVQSVRWNPVRGGSLVCCCGTGGLYLWTNEWANEGGEVEEAAECVGVPSNNFKARNVQWSPDGKAMILIDKEQFCCAIEVDNDSD